MAVWLRETKVQAERPRKRKPYTVFTAEQRATIGKLIRFQAWKRCCSEEVQGKHQRWSARRKHRSFVQEALLRGVEEGET